MNDFWLIQSGHEGPVIDAIEAKKKASGSPEAEAARSTEVRVQNGVAIIDIRGYITPTYDWHLAETVGNADLETITTRLAEALKDPEVGSIVFNIDSPGGKVTGVKQLADLIFKARSLKPIYAYSAGMMTSAAYWIGSAATKVFVDDTARIGSIGVITTFVDASDYYERLGVRFITFTSKQSPKKDLDPTQKSGQEQIQTIIDEICDVFVGSVASNRDVDRESVLKNFGQGGVYVGAKAVEQGLADGLSTLFDLSDKSFLTSEQSSALSTSNHEETQMNVKPQSPKVDATSESSETVSENSPEPKQEQTTIEMIAEKLLGLAKDFGAFSDRIKKVEANQEGLAKKIESLEQIVEGSQIHQPEAQQTEVTGASSKTNPLLGSV